MATTYWIGNGQQVAQVATLTVTAVSVGGTLSAVINTKTITYTCITGDTTSTAASGWQALLSNAVGAPEFGEITFTVSANVITATASIPGTPYTMTKNEAGGATCTLTTTQANVSQSDVNNADNWRRNGVAAIPQSGDDVIVSDSSIPLLWNLDAFSAVLFASFTRTQSFTGTVGLPENNPNGYYEYRPTYFLMGASVSPLPVRLGTGAGSGNGPTRERYNVGTYRTTLTVLASGSPADDYAIRFLGTHANNQITVIGTSVGVAMLPGETSTVDLATVDGGGTLDFGVLTTFTGTGGGGTLTVTGGSSTIYCTPAAVVARNNASVTLASPSGTYASVTANNGVQMTWAASFTITSLTVQKSSNVSNSNNLGAIVVTNATIDGDTCQIADPNNSVTWTNAPTINGQVTSGVFVFTGPRTLKLT